MRIKRFQALFPFIFILACFNLNAVEINITYPYENQNIPAVEKTFIFGNISPSTAPFYINGSKVDVYKNGAFITYLPVSKGEFAFNCELQNGTNTLYYTRSVNVNSLKSSEISTSTLHLDIISPSMDMTLRADDWINVYAVATPSKKAVFTIKGLVYNESMLEIPEGSGRYYGSYFIKSGDKIKNRQVKVKISGGKVKGSLKAVSKTKITIGNGVKLVETSSDTVVLKNGVRGGYMMFLPIGVKMVSDGKIGPMHRVRLSDSDSAWVSESKISLLKKGNRPTDTETGTIRLSKTEKGSMAKIIMRGRVPYIVRETENSLSVKLYYTRLHSNWVIYDSSDTFVKNVNFNQVGTNIAEINFDLNRKLWGYDIYYSGNSLVIDIKEPPTIARKWPKPLAGLNIVIDPGHSRKDKPPYDGAIGPMGTFEYEANLWISEVLKADFEALGADIIMTRVGDEDVPITERPRIAKKSGGDIFISVHNNALADGKNPFASPRGHSIYYYHNHSMDFARALHKSFVKNINLPDEGLRFGDYHVARMTDMPSVLIENAYMIFPEQEEMLSTLSFRKKLSSAIVKGTLDFFNVPEKPRNKKKRRGKNKRRTKR